MYLLHGNMSHVKVFASVGCSRTHAHARWRSCFFWAVVCWAHMYRCHTGQSINLPKEYDSVLQASWSINWPTHLTSKLIFLEFSTLPTARFEKPEIHNYRQFVSDCASHGVPGSQSPKWNHDHAHAKRLISWRWLTFVYHQQMQQIHLHLSAQLYLHLNSQNTPFGASLLFPSSAMFCPQVPHPPY